MAGKGGARKGSGRKSKADEQKANYIFVTALKRIYSKNTDEEAKIEFVKQLAESQRGQIFIAEHIFGKSPDVVHNLNENYNTDLTPERIKQINEVLESAY